MSQNSFASESRKFKVISLADARRYKEWMDGRMKELEELIINY